MVQDWLLPWITFAQMSIVATVLVVNHFVFLLRARNPPDRFCWTLIGFVPFNLPDLSKPKCSRSNRGKTKIGRPKSQEKSEKRSRVLTVEHISYYSFLETVGNELTVDPVNRSCTAARLLLVFGKRTAAVTWWRSELKNLSGRHVRGQDKYPIADYGDLGGHAVGDVGHCAI